MALSDFIRAMQAGSAAGTARRQADIAEHAAAERLRYNYFALAAQQANIQARIDAQRAEATAERSAAQSLLTQRLAQGAENEAAGRALREREGLALEDFRNRQFDVRGKEFQATEGLRRQGAENLRIHRTTLEDLSRARLAQSTQKTATAAKPALTADQALKRKETADNVLKDKNEKDQHPAARQESKYWGDYIRKNFPSMELPTGDEDSYESQLQGAEQVSDEEVEQIEASPEGSFDPGPTSGRTPLAQAPSSGMVTIKTDEDYKALASGARFIGPDGKVRRKP